MQYATVQTMHAFIILSHHCSGWVRSVGAPDLGEPSLWKPAAAVWAVCGQWVAGSLLQHVRADVEPARLWSGVSSFSVCVLSFVWPVINLLLCLTNWVFVGVFAGSLSHQPGWEGLDLRPPRLQPHPVQSCLTWPTTAWLVTKHSELSVKDGDSFLPPFQNLQHLSGQLLW